MVNNNLSQTISIANGLYDQMVPVDMGRYLAQELPNAQIIDEKDSGHFSTVNNYIEDILDYLKSRFSKSRRCVWVQIR